jgi:hypothetical protein
MLGVYSCSFAFRDNSIKSSSLVSMSRFVVNKKLEKNGTQFVKNNFLSVYLCESQNVYESRANVVKMKCCLSSTINYFENFSLFFFLCHIQYIDSIFLLRFLLLPYSLFSRVRTHTHTHRVFKVKHHGHR